MAESYEIARRLAELDAGTFQEFCDKLLPLVDARFARLEPYGRQLIAKKTTRGTPDSYARKPDGSYIAIQYTTVQSIPGQKALRDLEAIDDPKRCRIRDKVSEVVICLNAQLRPEDESALFDFAATRGWEFEYYSLNRLVELSKDKEVLLTEILSLPAIHELEEGDDLVVDNDWLERSGVGNRLEEEGFKPSWSRLDRLESRKLFGTEVVFVEDEKGRRCRVRWGTLILVKRRISNLSEIEHRVLNIFADFRVTKGNMLIFNSLQGAISELPAEDRDKAMNAVKSLAERGYLMVDHPKIFLTEKAHLVLYGES